MMKRRLVLAPFAASLLLIALAGCRAQATPTAMPVVAATVPPSPTLLPTDTHGDAARNVSTPPTPMPVAVGAAIATPIVPPSLTPTPTDVPVIATPMIDPTPDGVLRTARVPILMYHYISEPPPDADKYRVDLSVSPAQFEAHLQMLQEQGYTTISSQDLVYYLTRGVPLPPRPVWLTFDDGYLDNYTEAFPLLQKYGMRGTFFIITDFVTAERPGYMTWPQLQEMVAAGMEIGSHSRDHPDLRGRSVDYLVWQALGSQEAIIAHLGVTPRAVAYPAGRYDEQTIAVFRSAHFWAGLTIHQGDEHTTDGLFELKRIRVRGSYTADDLKALLHARW